MTNYEVPKWTEKWGYIVSVSLETNLVSIEQFGSWNTNKGSDDALYFYNSIITK